MSKNYKKYLQGTFIFIFLLVVLAAVPAISFAQGTNTGGGGTGATSGGGGTGTVPATGSGPSNITITNPFSKVGQNGNLMDLLYALLDNAIIPVGSVIVVIMIIYSGFMFVTARGNEEQLKVAKRSFTYAAIGAAILLGAKAIALAIQSTVNALK